MSGHTPGPWTVQYPKYDAIIKAPTQDALATVSFKIAKDSEAEANARLIAAAPELLNALKAVMGYIEAGFLVRNIDDDHRSDWAIKMLPFVRDLKAASDAIAKAEGEPR